MIRTENLSGKNKLLIIAILLAACCITAVLILCSISCYREILIDSRWKARVRIPSFFGAMSHSVCTVEFSEKNSQTKRIVVAENIFRQPVLLLPSAESNAFYCVYDFDVDWQLIKIFPTEPPKSSDAVLKGVIKSYDCRIDRITRKDIEEWKYAADELRRMSPSQINARFIGINLPFFPLNEVKLKEQLVDALQQRGGQGRYVDEN